MDTGLNAQLTFCLSGSQGAPAFASIDVADARPALLARHQDLAALRYDFPVVLFEDGSVRALSGVVDGLLEQMASGDDATRVSWHLLRLERGIRALAAQGVAGTLAELWDLAAAPLLAAATDDTLSESLSSARRGLTIAGRVVDCDQPLPRRLIRHLWQAAHDARARRFRRDLDVLVHKLSDILGADHATSAEGRSADRLRASVGSLDEATFDFQALSQMLRHVTPAPTLPARRRQRIERVLTTLRDQRFYSPSGDDYGFVFESCQRAVEAYWARRGQMRDIVIAMQIARLEIDGTYHEATHDALFEAAGAAGLDEPESAVFPDYLVTIESDQLDPVEQTALMEGLAAGLPLKVLVQTNDILDTSSHGPTHFGFGLRSRQLTNMAIGLNEVYAYQAPSSHLLKTADALRKGIDYRGPALFSVFSGASGHTGDLAPYLAAAAALESRAFPLCVYDPSAGTDWASRFSVAGNPRVTADWPIHAFMHENADHELVSTDLAFTFVDFVACDERYASHFAKVDRAAWHDRMVPVADVVDRRNRWGQVPVLHVVDRAHRLGRVLVEDVLVREARRCLDLWHSLQELGGIHNSHARRVLERERQEMRAREAQVTPAAEAAPLIAAPPEPREAPIPAPAAAEVRNPDEPYIETPRCSTCNECTQINNKMFAYNENKQAYIANPAAGTFRQLVEAAESCQVSIIHPGKPRDPHEPGLEELLKRAEPFV
jgi:hypothetical protein